MTNAETTGLTLAPAAPVGAALANSPLIQPSVLIAIDPGQAGGIAVRIGNQVTCHKMPETHGDVCALLRSYLEPAPSATKVYMEHVSGFIGEGHPGSSMFNFGRGFGQIEGILMALQVPLILVRPLTWTRYLALGSKEKQKFLPKAGLTKEQLNVQKKLNSQYNNRRETIWKNRLKSFAQRVHPWLAVTLATADALCILEYARRLELLSAPKPPQPQLSL